MPRNTQKRIQRKRSAGWKTPPKTINVSRPSKWGNPFKLVGDIIYIHAGYRRKIMDPWVVFCIGDIEKVLMLYSRLFKKVCYDDLDFKYWWLKFKKLDLSELRGKNLACYCKPGEPCHADVLLKLANEDH